MSPELQETILRAVLHQRNGEPVKDAFETSKYTIEEALIGLAEIYFGEAYIDEYIN